MDTTATPGEGIGIGAALGITLYGFAVVIASPGRPRGEGPAAEERWMIGVAMIVAAIVGGVLGAGFEKLRLALQFLRAVHSLVRSSTTPAGWALTPASFVNAVAGQTAVRRRCQVTADASSASPSLVAAACLCSRSAAIPSDAASAFAEADALLAAQQQLGVLAMRRIADVDARGLHAQEGFRSARSWLRDARPDGDTTDVWLGSSLREFPLLAAAVADGSCSDGGRQQGRAGAASSAQARGCRRRADRRVPVRMT